MTPEGFIAWVVLSVVLFFLARWFLTDHGQDESEATIKAILIAVLGPIAVVIIIAAVVGVFCLGITLVAW